MGSWSHVMGVSRCPPGFPDTCEGDADDHVVDEIRENETVEWATTAVYRAPIGDLVSVR